MKHLITLTIAILMCFNAYPQKVVYDRDNRKLKFTKDDLDLVLEPSNVLIPLETEAEAAALTSILPTAVDLGFKLVTAALEKRQQKFTAEYSIQRSYLQAGTLKGGQHTVPDLTFIRTVRLNKTDETALNLVIKARKIENFDGYYYYIASADLNYSKAKTTGKSRMFDYTIEIKPTFYLEGEKKAQELFPITITSIDFGVNTFTENKYRTDIIPLPKGGVFAEVSVKVVETNPAKVNADKILELYNKYKDDAKTIINNFIKTGEGSEESGSGGEAKKGEDKKDPNTDTGN